MPSNISGGWLSCILDGPDLSPQQLNYFLKRVILTERHCWGAGMIMQGNGPILSLRPLACRAARAHHVIGENRLGVRVGL